MIARFITSKVQQALRRQAAVALIGPRQAGKTTLALEIGKAAGGLDLEDSNDRNRLTEPILFFEKFEDRLIILDEIHHAPDLFEALCGVIDKGRRRKKDKNRFLILGSTSIDLLRQSRETLAGRIAYVDMGTLATITLSSFHPDTVNKSRGLSSIPTAPSWIPAFACLLQAGQANRSDAV